MGGVNLHDITTRWPHFRTLLKQFLGYYDFPNVVIRCPSKFCIFSTPPPPSHPSTYYSDTVAQLYLDK